LKRKGSKKENANRRKEDDDDADEEESGDEHFSQQVLGIVNAVLEKKMQFLLDQSAHELVENVSERLAFSINRDQQQHDGQNNNKGQQQQHQDR